MLVCACVYVLMSMDTLDGQKGASELWDSELQGIVSHPTWWLGTKLQSLAKAACGLQHKDSSPGQG